MPKQKVATRNLLISKLVKYTIIIILGLALLCAIASIVLYTVL